MLQFTTDPKYDEPCGVLLDDRNDTVWWVADIRPSLVRLSPGSIWNDYTYMNDVVLSTDRGDSNGDPD